MTERSSCLSASEVPLSAELEKLGSGACNGRLALNKCGIERIDIVRRYSEAIANIILVTIRRHRIPPNFRRLVLGCIEAKFRK